MSDVGRYELKYTLNQTQVIEALGFIHCQVHGRQEHPGRTIHSIYFDDLECQSVRDNLSGISERIKVRLRWYQSDSDTTTAPHLELKVKKGRLGYKEIIKLPDMDFDIKTILSQKIVAKIQRAILNTPIGCKLLDRHIVPMLYVSYYRDYFIDLHGVRVTMDSNIRFRQITPFKSISSLVEKRYPKNIMELKFTPQQKFNVGQLISKLHLTPGRHSKYLAGLAAFRQVDYI